MPIVANAGIANASVGRRYLVYAPFVNEASVVVAAGLEQLTERHRFELGEAEPLAGDAAAHLATPAAFDGLIVRPGQGPAPLGALRHARRWRKAGKPVYFHYPRESAVEVVDDARLRSAAKVTLAHRLYRKLYGPWKPAAPEPASPDFASVMQQDILNVAREAKPAPFGPIAPRGAKPRVAGTGLYLRLDYWSAINAGGSYGHTCYVAKELAARTEEFVCVLANRYKLIDDFGLRQFVLPHHASAGEDERLLATHFYRDNLRTLVSFLKPAFIYERHVPGNFAAAALAQELGVPYIVEYNGSELSMARTFGSPYHHERLFLEAEAAAFRQASVVSVVSEQVRQQVVRSGVDPDKVLVNPNAADPEDYRPASPAERREIRARFGWTDEDVVVAFVGTFGGWHGVEVLAEALPRICAASPKVKVLLIGAGHLDRLVKDAVAAHGLRQQVTLTGMMPQEEARIALRAGDVYVSPHHRDMVDGKFFGSPTKLFEYLALGGGIVASDLEQIGEVLRPSLRPADLDDPGLIVGDARAVACRPGDVDDFVAGVTGLVRRPDVRAALGANARRAAVESYTWAEHVDRLLDFAAAQAEPKAEPAPSAEDSGIDFYKREAQRQWDNDPCGSQYAETRVDRIAFFNSVEQHRYGEYGPWMPDVMEFDRHAGKRVLEIGSGLGTDLAQFAKAGALVTDFDISKGHMDLARENFALRDLPADFVFGDAETMPFADGSFDLVYSNGVIHHIPQTQQVVGEIHRVLKPGGKAIIMVYRENSLQYWRILHELGLRQGMLEDWSMHEIMSRSVEMSTSGARPLVKVYTSRQLRTMFGAFAKVEIVRRQLVPTEVPKTLAWAPLGLLERALGWNLIVKAVKG
jgi:glycosyltransferase involved in cell wall biosynthesis/SAM-dependent methyltransferase